MATIDLREFKDSDGFVLHFGGRPNEVDTYTFAHALVAFSDAFREINSQANPHLNIELRLEAVGPGSFRGKVKGVSKGIANALKWGATNAVFPLLMAFIYDHYVDDDTFEIEVTEEYVVIQQGRDRIIVPREAYNTSRSLPSPERVHEQINRAIDAVDDDPSVESFGLTSHLNDEKPMVDLPRENWGIIRGYRERRTETDTERRVSEEAALSIIKIVFSKSRRKWEFVWRGVKVSAFIEDPIFMADLMQGKYKVGNGDSIRCVLNIDQKWSDEHQVWLNTGYSVEKVLEFAPRSQNRDIFDG